MISPRLSRIFLFTSVLALAGSLTALAQHHPQQPASQSAQPTIKRETARRAPSLEGEDTYRTYCAVCHGTDGKGNGPAAPALKTAPADLTTYAQRHGGKLSSVDIREVVEGDRAIPAHGSREMPIWGDVFQSLYDRAQRELLIRNLVNHLESLQVR